MGRLERRPAGERPTWCKRPELFGAVVCQVPLIDMIRYKPISVRGASWGRGVRRSRENPPNRDWIHEILALSEREGRASAIRRCSSSRPPATIASRRCTPAKMAARMEAQGHEVLFYENTDGGHAARGPTTSRRPRCGR